MEKHESDVGPATGKKEQLVSQAIALDRWTTSPEYLRDLYGSDVAEDYVRLRDEEMKLSDEELRDKITRQVGELVVDGVANPRVADDG